MPGAISTEPVITCISALILFSLRNFSRITGYDVAILRLLNHSTPLYSMRLGIASESRHLLKPSSLIISTALSFSSTSFNPTIPMSAVPIATDSGISSSRRNSSSTGKLREGTRRVRFTEVILTPASESNSIVSSYKRPFDCTAILSFVSIVICRLLLFSNLKSRLPIKEAGSVFCII